MEQLVLDAALAYAERGWPVFPCRADKTPYTNNGVLDATTDPKRIREWWQRWPRANVAMDVGGAGMMVLDLDPGHDSAELAANVGGVPSTLLKQKTPRGGEHLFFALADGEVVAPSTSKLAPHVDVRSFHSYVLLAPSRTADGAYSWTGSPQAKPAYRTDEMVRVANTGARAKSEDRDTWLIKPDLPENVEAAIAWLRKDARIAIEGQQGDATAYATAAHLKSYGISQELALDLMWEHWNPRCSPPWTEGDIEHFEAKVENGYAYNTSPPGNITAAYKIAKAKELFKPVVTPLPSGKQEQHGRFRFVDRAGMAHIKPPAWIIQDFLPEEAYMLLWGGSGTFKTFLALDIALSVATAVDRSKWHGLPVLQSGPVLFTAGEGRASITKRVQAWERTYLMTGDRAEDFVLADPVPNIMEEWEPFLDGALAMSPGGYKLVVLDTIGKAMQGANENAQEYASKFTQLVETIRRETGAAVLCLHHTGHSQDDRERGSSVFRADADTSVEVERAGKDFSVSLRMAKQKDAPEWERPRRLSVSKVQVGPDHDSLVVVDMPAKKADEAKAAESRSRFSPTRNDDAMLEILDRAVKVVLDANPSRAWTQRELAEAVAMREEIEVGSERLRSPLLTRLREDKQLHARLCYDAATKRWRAAR